MCVQVYKDRNVVAQLVRRAERAGFKAIALTVDTPRLGRRESDIKNRFVTLRIYHHITDFALQYLQMITYLFAFRFVLPPGLNLKNFEGLDLGKMDEVSKTISLLS